MEFDQICRCIHVETVIPTPINIVNTNKLFEVVKRQFQQLLNRVFAIDLFKTIVSAL